jgi:hypothetical protein
MLILLFSSFTGTVPTEVWAHPSLQYLEISSTFLSGTVATELGLAMSLIWLYGKLVHLE